MYLIYHLDKPSVFEVTYLTLFHFRLMYGQLSDIFSFCLFSTVLNCSQLFSAELNHYAQNCSALHSTVCN